MAKAKKAAALKSATKKKVARHAKPQEVIVRIELHIPQLDNINNRNLHSPGPPRVAAITARGMDETMAKLTITPVRDIHITEVEVNAILLATDTDVLKDIDFTISKPISPTRPLSLFIHITGIANTMVAIEFALDEVTEFKGSLFIPNSGRLVIQKIIA